MKRINKFEQIEDNWPNIRAAIAQAIDPYPEAKEAVIVMLQVRRNGNRNCDLYSAIISAYQ